MTDTPDYGEPWTTCGPICKLDIANADNEWVGDTRDPDIAARAVACVNACAGIRDPEKVIPLMVEFAQVARIYRNMKDGMYKEFGATAARYKELLDAIKEASQ